MLKLLFVLFGIGLAVTNGSHHFFFRRDYTYIAEFDAFYKFHWDPTVRSWADAFKACDDEGAKLFYPKEDLEWTVVNNLTAVNVTEVILGLSEFSQVDGQLHNIGVTLLPTFNSAISGSKPRCIYMNISSGLHNIKGCSSPESIPFVCKKVDESPCPTIDEDYIYYKELRKCYKVNNRRTTWQEAYQNCFQEGAMLLVVENMSEAFQIGLIVELEQTYHAGLSKIGTDFFAVTGKRMEKIYKMWDGPEPQPVPCNNNDDDSINCNENTIPKDCGAVLRNNGPLFITRVKCTEELPFVCEMTANFV